MKNALEVSHLTKDYGLSLIHISTTTRPTCVQPLQNWRLVAVQFMS